MTVGLEAGSPPSGAVADALLASHPFRCGSPKVFTVEFKRERRPHGGWIPSELVLGGGWQRRVLAHTKPGLPVSIGCVGEPSIHQGPCLISVSHGVSGSGIPATLSWLY